MKPIDENKLLYFFLVIFVIATYITLALGLNNWLIAVGALLTFAYFIIRSRIYDLRVESLKDFAEKNHYQFIATPNKNLLGKFEGFKSLNSITSKYEPLLNLLIPSTENDDPHIVTAKRAISNPNGGPDTVYYTQLFLFNIEKKIPKFYIRKKSWFEDFLPGRPKAILKGLKLTSYFLSYPKNKKFPRKKYFCFIKDDASESFISDRFIELLNLGIEKRKKQINIESDGNNLLFYVHHRRHSQEDMAHYINLFKVLKNSLLQ
jgi:hypothetical protein